MKKIYLSYLFFFFLIAPKAQVTNYGATITVNPGGLLYINGDYTHNNGTTSNSGTITINGDYTHINGTIANNGTITINGNWENKAQANNYVFEEGSKGLVEFTGEKQKISGQKKTIFPNLSFLNGGEIELGQNVEVRLSLDLGSSQVFTNSYKLTLRNPDLNSLTPPNGKIKGVINTNGGGAFVRKTNEKGVPYLFPVGKKPDAIYPVTLAPVDDKFNFYEVSMINEKPKGYSEKSPDINFINDKYYYQITDLNGNSLENITFYTKPLEDFNWVISLESNKWEKWPHFEKNKGYSLYDGFNNSFKLSRLNLPAKEKKLFTLAKATDDINLEIYNAFSPNGDGKNDTWDIKNIDLYPDNDVKIYDRSGNLVYKYSGYTSAKGWDGQNSPSGSYYYILRVKIGGEDKYYKGSVTLVKN